MNLQLVHVGDLSCYLLCVGCSGHQVIDNSAKFAREFGRARIDAGRSGADGNDTPHWSIRERSYKGLFPDRQQRRIIDVGLSGVDEFSDSVPVAFKRERCKVHR